MQQVKPHPGVMNNDRPSNGMTSRSSATTSAALPSILKGGSAAVQQRQTTAISSRPSPALDSRYSHEDDEDFFAPSSRPDPRVLPRMLLHDVTTRTDWRL